MLSMLKFLLKFKKQLFLKIVLSKIPITLFFKGRLFHDMSKNLLQS